MCHGQSIAQVQLMSVHFLFLHIHMQVINVWWSGKSAELNTVIPLYTAPGYSTKLAYRHKFTLYGIKKKYIRGYR